MINLFTTYYKDKDADRHAEYLRVIQYNLDNSDIDQMFFLLEPETDFPFENAKVHVIRTAGRPTFQNFILAINENTGSEDYNVIANTDIYFDETLQLIRACSFENKVLALNRWDVLKGGELSFFNKYYSTDTWVFKGQVKNIDAPYYIGQQGCDNRFNYDLFSKGYQLQNPSYKIRTLHLHVSEVRSYVKAPNSFKVVDKPYLYLLPDLFWLSNLSGLARDMGGRQSLKVFLLYRHIRYDFYKKILNKEFEKGIEFQKETSRFKAALLCVLYFNYFRFNITSIKFKLKR